MVTLTPEHVTGIQGQYLEALRAEAKAKQDYDIERKSCQVGHARTQIPSDGLLLNHINTLRQQQHHMQLIMLTEYVSKFGRLVPKNFVEADQEDADYPDHTLDQGCRASRCRAQKLLRELEVEVVEAKHEAERREAALQEARAKATADNFSPASRQQALNTVRGELTRWIENSLAQCGVDDIHAAEGTATQNADSALSKEDVKQAYERYSTARKTLATATEDLSHPLQDMIEEPVMVGRTKVTPLKDLAVDVGAQLSQWQHERSMAALMSYAQGELGKEETESVETLQRLADESQLLPSYPLLSRTGRFKVAASQRSSNKVGQQVEAWKFAGGAAENATSMAVSKDVFRGNQAIEQTRESMGGIALLREAASGAEDGHR